MDPDKDIAEERLLRVIEKGQSRTSSAVGQSRGGNPIQWVRMWLARRYAQPVGRDSDPLLRALRVLSFVLWSGLIGFGIYFAYNFVVAKQISYQDRLAQPRRVGTALPNDALVPQLREAKPDSYYVGALQNPNPFTGTGEEQVQIVDEPRGPSPKDKINQMSKSLVVVGINRGPIPDAIIEDSEQKRTHFVKVGDSLNELKVVEIKHNTVVLSYEGETVEIG